MNRLTLRSQLHFKVAETADELNQVYRLLHDAYVKRGVMKPKKDGLRITRWHLLPTTRVLVAKSGSEVVGTLSVIEDNLLGLPIDKMWDLSHLREEAFCLAEISSLALKQEVRMRPMQTLMPLISYLMHYLYYYTSVDTAVIATHVRSSGFYRDNLVFEKVSSEVVAYDFVQGAESLAQYVRPEIYWKMSAEKSQEPSRLQKRAQFIVDNPHIKNFQFPSIEVRPSAAPA